MHAVETLAYAGEKPWHGLGVEVEADYTPEEILVAAGLDWTVEKVPLEYDWRLPGGSEDHRFTSKRMSLIRTTDGSELTLVSGKWSPIQNHEAFGIFDRFVKEGGMTMETAGSIFNGRIVWALARTTEEFSIFNGDRITGYFLFSNPHVYGKSAQFGGTSIRVVCNNTHSWALKSGLDNKVSINHRKAFNPATVHDNLAELHRSLSEFKDMAEFLGGRRYTEETVREYFDKVFPISGRNPDPKKEHSLNSERAWTVIESQPGAEHAPGTWWNAYNAVSYVTDHVAGNNDNNRLNSAWFGRNRNRKTRALGMANEYAAAA